MLAIVACMPRPLAELWELPEPRLRASQAADRIYRYLNQIPAVSQAVGAKFLEPVSRTIGFEAVSYTLPNKRKLLDGIDLTLSAGEVIALVAFEPLEARAMACLLPRFIEPQSGRILFDGEDIAWGTLESLRAETVYVGGSDPFFTGTVVENIICSHSGYTLSDVTEAAKTTHAHHFILKLPQGYETVIGEHGERLDAGQGFRLGLARAVLRNPSLLIIEEPTEALDEDTKSLLDDSYNRIVRGRTVVILAEPPVDPPPVRKRRLPASRQGGSARELSRPGQELVAVPPLGVHALQPVSSRARNGRLVLVALPCRVESLSFPDDFRRGTATLWLHAL